MEKRLITAALPYINNLPHFGHIIGCHLPADIFARYCRLKGHETLFVGGTDENGSTTEISAEKLGVKIEDFCSILHNQHKKIYDWFSISYDNFSRTTKKIHHETTKDFFSKLYKNGFIEKGKMKVFYSVKENRFLADRYIKGECPKCGYTEANGDQCEKCTALIDPSQLLNPVSVLSGDPLEIREVDHLFLRLDKLSEELRVWLEGKKDLWREQVVSLALGWIKEGLKPRCITRDLKHGVKVPLEDFKDKVFYVWFDAPIGYLSFTKEISNDWENFWKKSEGKIYHFLGKDNIPFHTIFWPGMLIGNGDYNLPFHVEGLQYLNFSGEKFSKSKKRGVFCESFLGTDIDSEIFRAYLSFILPDSADSEFSWSDFQRRVNSELIGNLGNFINRSLSFVFNKLEGKVEKPAISQYNKSDLEFLQNTKEKLKLIESHFEAVKLKNAFFEIFSLSSCANKYFNDAEPWKKIDLNKEEAKKVLYLCIELIEKISIIISPFLPKTSNRIREQLNLEEIKNGCWDKIYQEGFSIYNVKKPKILFSLIEDDYLNNLIERSYNVKDIKDFFQ